ncbi:Uncharacterised protein [Mycobacteroides abscessus subsp. abscessus]|nr:Uncharacterised protein [Mycobacteroides abscessus subsp. abscessus]
MSKLGRMNGTKDAAANRMTVATPKKGQGCRTMFTPMRCQYTSTRSDPGSPNPRLAARLSVAGSIVVTTKNATITPIDTAGPAAARKARRAVNCAMFAIATVAAVARITRVIEPQACARASGGASPARMRSWYRLTRNTV